MNKKEIKENKKVLKNKTHEEREEEVNEIKRQLNELALDESIYGITEFYEITEDYINKGYGASGSIKLPELNRTLYYILPLRKTTTSTVCLKQTKN